MMILHRYALYAAPRPGPLASFAAAWLGRDAETGEDVAHPAVTGLPRPLDAITAAPRRYGFHGTIKPPFPLAEGRTEHDLRRACAALARRLNPISVGQMSVGQVGGFLALVPKGDQTALQAWAADVVRSLDPFRASLTDADRQRRDPARLSPRQRALLERWGYPHVMDEFRFHMTLTGDLPDDDAVAVHQVLVPMIAPHLANPFVIDDLCLFGEGPDGRFRILHRYALTG
jgi:putative phosphonate metabolism protein